MRMLTFKGFLESYLKHLSGQQTASLSKLAPLTEDNKRLVEPLLLWAVVTNKTRTLAKLLQDQDQPKLQDELVRLATMEAASQLESVLSGSGPALREEYLKVWRSYVARRDAHLRDERLKLVARERVLALEEQTRVSRYRMAKDLRLNQGNLYAFLNQGNPQKLSLERAYELVNYLESCTRDAGSARRTARLGV